MTVETVPVVCDPLDDPTGVLFTVPLTTGVPAFVVLVAIVAREVFAVV
jgi:hypothetical protein